MIQEERFQIHAAADANYLSITLSEPVMLDNIAIRLIQEDKPDFLLPLQLKVINDQQSLRYKLVNAISLSNNIPKSMPKQAYIKLALTLLTPFVKCRDWFLDYHYICINPQLVLYNKQTDSYLFAYMPEASLRNEDEEIIRFFEHSLNRISISDDPYYQVSIMAYFRDGNITLSEMYQMFWSEREKMGGSSSIASTPPVKKAEPIVGSVPATPIQATAPSVGQTQAETESSTQTDSSNGKKANNGILGSIFNGTKKKPAPATKTPSPESGSNYFATSGTSSLDMASSNSDIEALFGNGTKSSFGGGLFGGGKKESKPTGGLFGSKKEEPKPAFEAQPAPQKQVSAPTSPANPPFTAEFVPDSYAGGDETSIAGTDSNRNYLELIDSRFSDVPLEISLDFDKPYITIGRHTSDGIPVDVAFPDHCRGISRHHARITCDNGAYFIADLGSAYHTLVDDKCLIPNINEPLLDGMIVTFVKEKPVRYRVHCSGRF